MTMDDRPEVDQNPFGLVTARDVAMQLGLAPASVLADDRHPEPN